MNPVVLRFDPNGIGHCLYTELLDLTAIGPLKITLASFIEFNERTQQWEVQQKRKVLFTHRSRAVCLAWERQHFNR